MDKNKIKDTWHKFWYFIWESESVWSWIANVVLAFIIIKFLVYPALGFALGTTHPIVAVVSGSMEHKIAADAGGNLMLCGKEYPKKQSIHFEEFWNACGQWYEKNFNITSAEFKKFKLSNGFNKGDIIVIIGTPVNQLKVGDVIVYRSYRPDPIIHRIVNIWTENNVYFMQTKGDHNEASFQFEAKISQKDYIGRAALRIPYLGYVKIIFVEFLNLIGLITGG